MNWEKKPELHNLGIRQGHPLARGMVGYWPMWEGGGSSVMDVAQCSGTATMQNTGSSSWATSKYGHTLSLDGSDDYLSVSRTVVTGPPFTVIAIATIPNTTLQAALFSLSNNTASSAQHALVVSLNGTVSAGNNLSAMSRNGGSFLSGLVPVGLQANTWYHMAGVWSSTSLRTAYVNVANSGSNPTLVDPTGINNTEIARLGDSSPNWQWPGKIASLWLWDRALSVGELWDHYSDPWSLIRPRQRTYFPVGASGSGATPVTGTAAQTTPAAQQSASGTETLTGTATQTAPAAQQSASGAQGIAGAAAQTTGSATQSASGAETMSGAAAQEAPEPTQESTGTLTIIGTVVQEAPSATQSASVLLAVPITCTITQTAPAATQAVTGISAVGVLGYAVSMAPAATQILVVVETPPTGEPINGTYDVSATLSGTFDVIEQLAGTY